MSEEAMEQVIFSEDYYRALREGDIPEKQALAMSHALRIALHQGVATRGDMQKLTAVVGGLSTKADGIETSTNGLKNDFKGLKDDVGRVKLLIYLTMGVVALTSPLAMHVFKLIISIR
jgi:hypothetical protein